jgi:DNA-binding MarR family transcriptional regulator
MTSAARFTPEEMGAWKALRLMSRQLEAHLARELARTSDLSLQDYDVLSSVASLPEHRWSAKSLMHHLQWSYSRLSHHLDRMEQRALVTREQSRQGPGIDVVITEIGMAATRAATGGHLSEVRRTFVDRLKPGDAGIITRLSRDVIDGLPGPTPERGW